MTQAPKETRILEITRCFDCGFLKDGINCIKSRQYIIEPTKIPASCPLPRPSPAPAPDVITGEITPVNVPKPCPYWGIRFGMWVCKYREIGDAEDEHDAAMTRKAREDVLKKIDERILILTDARDNEFKQKCDIKKAQYGITQLEIVKSWLESLRHTEQEQPR